MLEDISINKICDILINRLKSIPYGSKSASEFHNLMIGIFELLLLIPITDNDIIRKSFKIFSIMNIFEHLA